MAPPLLRHMARSAVHGLLDLSASLRGTLASPGICLMYHRVGLDPDDSEQLCVSRPSFESQVRHMAEHCEVVPLERLADPVESCLPGGRPRVAITFDDGYRDNIDVAADILARHGLPATFFVTVGFVAGTLVPWWEHFGHELRRLDSACCDTSRQQARKLRDQLARHWSIAGARQLVPSTAHSTEASTVDAPGPRKAAHNKFMSPTDVAALAAYDIFTVGSHTVTHRALSTLSPIDRLAELSFSRQALQAWTGVEVRTLAYPYGDLDAQTRQMAAACGYSLAVAVHPGQVHDGVDPLEMPRHEVPDIAGETFADWLATRRRVQRLPLRSLAERSARPG